MKTGHDRYAVLVPTARGPSALALPPCRRARDPIRWLAVGLLVPGLCLAADPDRRVPAPGPESSRTQDSLAGEAARGQPSAGLEPVAEPGVDTYPLRNQSPARQLRDHAECRARAAQRSGLEPAAASPVDEPRTRVVHEDEGRRPRSTDGAAAGAAGGAAVGAASGAIAGEAGVAVGAAVGAVAGLVAGAAQDRRGSSARAIAPASSRHIEYRRAIASCLRERGYDVRQVTNDKGDDNG